MPRPTKLAADKRDQRFNLRLTLEELAVLKINAAAAGITPTEYARLRVLGHKVKPARSRIEAGLLSELNRLGVNLNQITRTANAGGVVEQTAAELVDEIAVLLDKIGASV